MIRGGSFDEVVISIANDGSCLGVIDNNWDNHSSNHSSSHLDDICDETFCSNSLTGLQAIFLWYRSPPPFYQ